MAEQKTKETAAPFSVRLTKDERALLVRRAGNLPLDTYVRARLLDDSAAPRRHVKKPVVDKCALARVLAMLGQSRLANNLNQLARAANSGSLPVTPDTEAMLRSSYQDIQTMKKMLMSALGVLER